MQNQRSDNDIPKWSALLVEAVNKPGLIMQAYSVGNQLLALVQCQMRPTARADQYLSEMEGLGPLRQTWRTGADFVHANNLQTPKRRLRRRTHLY